MNKSINSLMHLLRMYKHMHEMEGYKEDEIPPYNISIEQYIMLNELASRFCPLFQMPNEKLRSGYFNGVKLSIMNK